MATPQTPQPRFVEERFFEIDPQRHRRALSRAIERAFGAQLDERAPGLYRAERVESAFVRMELTVRVLPVEEGALVEVELAHVATPFGIVVVGTFLIAASILIVPLLIFAGHQHRTQRLQAHERIATMHGIWTELVGTIGAPKRSTTYREAPRPAYELAAEAVSGILPGKLGRPIRP